MFKIENKSSPLLLSCCCCCCCCLIFYRKLTDFLPFFSPLSLHTNILLFSLPYPLQLFVLMVDRFPAMLEYEWGNPSAVIISGGGDTHDPFVSGGGATTNESSLNLIYPHHNHHAFAQSQHFQQPPLLPPPPPPPPPHEPHLHHPSIYDPRAFVSASSYTHPYSLEHGGHPSGFMVVPKSEPCVVGGGGMADFAATIGLNLGGRTYFSASDDHDFVNRLYRRSRGGGEVVSVNAPRCQAEGCNADLSHGKHYHRRHKVCEFHSKAATVVAAGLTQRFCQQCSRFHPLNEFDNGKRSCRKRLADHNRRRRKSHQPPDKYHHRNSPSASNSGAHQSCSSVTVAAISPPRMSLDCFGRQSSSSGSLFYSNG